MPASDQGVNKERYLLIPRTLIFLSRGEYILLIKGSANKRLWANLYNGIGGHVEPGEDVYSAATRELYEETGLTAETLWLCAVATIETGQNPGVVLFVFRGECTEGQPFSSQEGTSEWIPISQLASLPLVEDLPVLLDRILPMRKDQPPLAVQYFYGADGMLNIKFADQ